jgi:multidrug resistance efflux pump
MTPVSNTMRVFITAGFILIAIAAVGLKWWQYQVNPWTRDGQVRAQVIQITPRVSGTIVELPIVDNQFVKKDDLLFQIDPRTYESTLHGMEGLLAETEDEIEALTAQVEATAKTIERYDAAIQRAEQKLKGKAARVEDYRAQVKRYEELVKTGAASEERRDRAVADFIDSEAVLDGARAELLAAEAIKLQAEADLARDIANRGAEGKANARRRTAKARVHSAELNLEFTTVRAPVDGYVTHLDLRPGDHAAANHAALALVDVNSYWIYGYFKEHYVGRMQVGDRAQVTLMSAPDTPVEGRVTGWGWGIFQSDGSTAQQLLPKIAATFKWVRMPQRVPIRVELDELPEGVELVVGTRASVLVRTGTAGSDTQGSMSAAPEALQ